uniref:G-protein coupled receptors family 1 profile domain-containing protein n=1 Tax=Neolamprologus brichardi TaxID=32507 RepID=A0A3Q4I5B3_NEOBR
ALARGTADSDVTRTQHPVVTAAADSPAHGSDLSLRALTGCVLCVLIVSTLLGNALVCAAVIKFRHLRSKVTNAFVISLAVSDLFKCCCSHSSSRGERLHRETDNHT